MQQPDRSCARGDRARGKRYEEAAKAVDETAATNDTHMLTVPTLRKRLAEQEAARQAALGI